MTETGQSGRSLYRKEKRLPGLHIRYMEHARPVSCIFTAKMYTHAQRNVSEASVLSQMSCIGDIEWT
jgi:hypothetical protein